MGEYVGDFKVGTCESLYYVRYTDLLKMQKQGIECSEYLDEKHGFRYRFPFPDEDDLNFKADGYDDFDRVFPLPIPPQWAEEHNTGFCGVRQQKMVGGQLRIVLTLGENYPNLYSFDEEEARELFDFLDSEALTSSEEKCWYE